MAASAEAVAAATKPLDWHDRPASVKAHIETTFRKISADKSSKEWLYSGGENYGLCGINEIKLIRKIIQEAPTSQKKFWIMDIGAGDFQWTLNVAERLGKATDLPDDITIHLVGLRGERDLEEHTIKLGRCQRYNLGGIKIEELSSELSERFDLINKVDLIVSRWTFRHLTDPTGTFIQAFNLLRPGSGMMALDGFFSIIRLNQDEYEDNRAMMRIIMDTHALFLSRCYTAGRSMNHFLIKRVDDTPCALPLRYSNVRTIPSHSYQASAGKIIKFVRTPQEEDEPIVLPRRFYQTTGDKSLYEWLRSNGLFNKMIWTACRAKDKGLENPPLHQAIQASDYNRVEALLTEGANINESNSDGSTALHLAVSDDRMLSLVLSHDPLHTLRDKDENTALDLTLDTDNTSAREMLIKAGARKVNWDHKEILAKILDE